MKSPAFLAPFSSTFRFSPPSHHASCTRPALPARPAPRSTLQAPRAPPIATPPSPSISSEPVPGHPDWRFTGPPLIAGPLPAVVYLALSASQSLELPPFNQLAADVVQLSPGLCRVFSVTLPFHGEDMARNEVAFSRWAELYEKGGDPVANFVRKASDAVDALVASGAVARGQVVVAGLSRGGLLAGLLAVRNENVKAFLGFAPVTVLGDLDEFGERNVGNERAREKVGKASLLQTEVIEKLVGMPVRFYMGNFDTRVGTRKAFDFVHLLAERAVLHEGMRSPPHEFVMYCSVGKHGHGTPPDVFRAGAEYAIAQIMELQAEMYN